MPIGRILFENRQHDLGSDELMHLTRGLLKHTRKVVPDKLEKLATVPEEGDFDIIQNVDGKLAEKLTETFKKYQNFLFVSQSRVYSYVDNERARE